MKEFENSSWSHLLPSTDLEVDTHNFHEFFRTMAERQRIFMKRSNNASSKPWTKDSILRDYRFTNVYRELDRNSVWEIKNITSDHSLTMKDVIWKICLFRLFNKIELFDYIGGVPSYDDFSSEQLLKKVREFRKIDNPYTSSYYVNSTFGKGKDKDASFCEDAAMDLHSRINRIQKIILTGKSPEELIREFRKIPGVGSFIAHEFYISLTYAAKYWKKPIMKWDENDYTNVGPGASMGIRLIFPSLATIEEQKQGIYWLRDLAPEYMHEHFIDFEYLKWDNNRRAQYFARSAHNLTLHQIEMWLCEYSKYWKMVNKIGRQRSKFQPRTEKYPSSFQL